MTRAAETIEVAAAVLRDDEGRVLVSRRLAGRHLAGLWEFPGGKIEPGEAPEAALARGPEARDGRAPPEECCAGGGRRRGAPDGRGSALRHGCCEWGSPR